MEEHRTPDARAIGILVLEATQMGLRVRFEPPILGAVLFTVFYAPPSGGQIRHMFSMGADEINSLATTGAAHRWCEEVVRRFLAVYGLRDGIR